MSFGAQKESSTPKKSQKEPTQITCPFTTQYSTNYCRASLQACCTNNCSVPSRDSLPTTGRASLQERYTNFWRASLQGCCDNYCRMTLQGMVCQLLQSELSRDALPTTSAWASRNAVPIPVEWASKDVVPNTAVSLKGCSTNYFRVSLQECSTNYFRVGLQGCCSKYWRVSLQGRCTNTAEWTFKGCYTNYCRVNLQGMVCQLLQSKPPEQSSVWLKYLENRASERKLAI